MKRIPGDWFSKPYTPSIKLTFYAYDTKRKYQAQNCLVEHPCIEKQLKLGF